MERGYEEKKTQESARGGAWPAGRFGTQRGQAARQPRKWPQGWSGQKPQEEDCRTSKCAAPAPRSKKEVIETVIALIRARFGETSIGLGERGFRGEGLTHAHTA
jgi:hypothetical protein